MTFRLLPKDVRFFDLFVADGENGFVAAPEPDALAAAVAKLADDRALAARFGRAARARVAGITWPAVVRTLLEAGGLA